MEPPDGMPDRAISGGTATGMTLYRQLRDRDAQRPILVLSGTQDQNIVDILRDDPKTVFISKWTTPRLRDLARRVEECLGIVPQRQLAKCFIVHGHDDKAKLELKNYLQNSLGFDEPIILHEQPNLGRTIIEKLEDYADACDAAFVLLTPDDQVVAADKSNDTKRRARQNVIFELGYFLGIFGRESGRVFLLHKGPLELPSDLSGVIYIDISHGIDASGESLRKELKYVLK